MPIFNRNSISLETLRPGGNEFYDQAYALSQGTINANFKRIFDMCPELSKVAWTDERVQMLAKVKAPRVEFDLLDLSEPQMYFSLEFISGKIVFDGSDAQSLDRWIITVTSSLKELTVTKVPGRNPKEERQANAVLAELNKTFAFPTQMLAGEYSIHRLFAAIAEHKWGSPITSKSFAPLGDGKLVNLDEWATDRDSTKRQWDTLSAIGLWAKTNQNSSLFTLGIQLRLTKPEDDPQKPTFAPKALRLQNYPYISEADQQKLSDQGEKFQGTNGNDLNCLVFCETTGNRDLPNGEQILFRGNLATPETPGTFVLERRLFIEKYLLPQLQELCVATQVIPLCPEMGYDEQGMDHWQAALVVGGDPPKKEDYPDLPPQVASDPSFRFRPEGKNKYVWSNHLRAPGSGPASQPGAYTKNFDQSKRNPFFRKWTISTDQSVTVTWVPGSDTFKVAGKSTYDHWEGYDNYPNFNWGTGYFGENGRFYGTIIVESSWSIDIDLHVPEEVKKNEETPNGVIQPKILKCDASWLPLDLKVEANMHYVLDETHQRIKNQILASLQRKLPEVNKHLQQSFNGMGCFVYPGSSELSFGPPSITESGNIIAAINYLPPKGDRIIVKTPVQTPVIPVPQPIKPPMVIAPPIPVENPPRLTWRTNVEEYNPGTKHCKISLKALNLIKTSAVAFSMVSIIVLWNGKTTTSPGLLYTQDLPEAWKLKNDLPAPTPAGGVENTAETTASTKNGVSPEEAKQPSEGVTLPKGTSKLVDSFSLAQTNITQPLQMNASFSDLGLSFTIRPGHDDNGGAIPDRFVLSSGASFEIDLEGAVKGEGSWILRMNEVWNSAVEGEKLTEQTANSYFRVELKNEIGKIDSVSEEVANGIRGI